jgi:hypothetical protein
MIEELDAIETVDVAVLFSAMPPAAPPATQH